WGDYGAPVCVGEPGGQEFQQSVPDMQGGVIDVWEDNLGGSDDYLYAQHLDADGNPQWAENGMALEYPPGQPIGVGGLCDGVPDGSGGGVWAYITAGWWNYLRMIRVNGQTGRVEWSWQAQVYCPRGFASMLRHPDDGSAWISCSEDRGGGFSRYLYRHTVDNQALFGGGGLPYGGMSIAPCADGVITAETFCDYVSQSQVKARRVSNAGELLWQNRAALGGLSPGGGGVYDYVATALDGSEGAVLVFEDERNPENDTDLSAQRVLSDGSLGSPPFTPPPAEHQPLGQVLYSAGGLVRFSLPQPGAVKLELFDLLGRRVAVLSEGYRQSGDYVLKLDTGELPSGIYLLRLSAASLRQIVKVVVLR
ncbi:MAG: T9SS type A sorting domain-containing protein, partial [bacterium]